MAEGTSLRRLLHGMCKATRIAWHWAVRLVKVQFLKCRRCKAQRVFDERTARLGTEVYSLYRQGETEFQKSIAVEQRLKLAEEAESRLFSVYDRMEEADRVYRENRERIAAEGHETPEEK